MTDEIKNSYEKNQNFNALVRWIHNIRYNYIIEIFNVIHNKNPEIQIKIVEIGCANAKLFGILNKLYSINYVGIEINQYFAENANNKYGHLSNFKIINDNVTNHYEEFEGVDFIIALETFEHIPENIVVRLIERISSSKPKYFICSVPNEIGPIVWIKNIGSILMGYMRHKEYKWSDTLWAGFYQLDYIETHGIGHKGFDWRWFAQTIRFNRKISQTFTSPFRYLPKTLSLSIIFITVCL